MRPRGQGSRRRGRGAGGPGEAAGPRPPRRRKSLGQHHLKNGAICRPLVEFLRLGAGQSVLEIGPGAGILTLELLRTGARVAALELDLAWACELRRKAPASHLGENGGLRVVAGDALELAWEGLAAGWRVAGNLPYNVGTPIVERLLRGAREGTRAAFLLQREVVDRIVAAPGDEAYGALSVLVALRARASRLGIVKPGAFVPPPKVDSAFVGLETIAAPLDAAGMESLERMIGAAFSQRRKSLRNSLAASCGRERTLAALAAAGIDPSHRAEVLSRDEFLGLHEALGRIAAE